MRLLSRDSERFLRRGSSEGCSPVTLLLLNRGVTSDTFESGAVLSGDLLLLSVLHCLCYMLNLDHVFIVNIGDSAAELEDAVIGAGVQPHAPYCNIQQLPGFRRQDA